MGAFSENYNSNNSSANVSADISASLFQGASGVGRVEVKKSGPLDVLKGLLPGGGDDETANDVSDPQSRVLNPSGEAEPPRQLSQGDRLRVTSFNVHHMDDRDDDDQTGPIIDALRNRAPSDAYLLQEMPPEKAQEVADEMGMNGYYSRTSETQGNLTLLHPDLRVSENERGVLNGDFPPADSEGARAALDYHKDTPSGDDIEGQFREPRAVQALRVQKPTGESALLWNTHLTAGLEDNARDSGATLGGLRQTETETLDRFLNDVKEPKETVVGGGDLNSKPGESVLPLLGELGYKVTSDTAQDGLDHMTVRGPGEAPQVLVNEQLFDGEQQISDHPILKTLVELG